jgi:hypothetical protein
MLNRLTHPLAAVFLSTLLAACGGGSDGPAGPTGPVPGAAPTAAISSNETTATALATEAKSALSLAKAVSAAQAINPLGMPTGVIETTQCGATLDTGTMTVNAPATASAGATATITFADCTFVPGMTINGRMTIRIETYTSDTNFTFSATYALSITGDTPKTLNASQSCSVTPSAVSCGFTYDGRTFEGTVNLIGNVASGTYQWTYSNVGTVRFTLTGWTDTSGTIQVSGANNTTATIVRTGASTFNVTIGGTMYPVTLP